MLLLGERSLLIKNGAKKACKNQKRALAEKQSFFYREWGKRIASKEYKLADWDNMPLSIEYEVQKT